MNERFQLVAAVPPDDDQTPPDPLVLKVLALVESVDAHLAGNLSRATLDEHIAEFLMLVQAVPTT